MPPPKATFRLDQLHRETSVRRIEYREQLASTNDFAIELAAAGATETPLLVLAARQTGGRGRGVNRWWASEGALTFSLLLDTTAANLPVRTWPRVSLTTGLAVCRGLLEVLPRHDLRVKWPNDVYLQARKVCGVLVENPPASDAQIVIGVGVNVNNRLAGGPVELQSRATSLADVTGATFDRTELLILLLRQITEHLAAIGSDTLELSESWRELCMLEGRTLRIDSGSRSLIGVCQGIDDEGTLLLRTEAGIQRCAGGVVAEIY